MTQNLRNAESWAGVWTALVTPLNSKRELDDVSFEKLIEAQILGGIKGFVIAGSTGEGSLLSAASYEHLLATAQKLVKGRLPLVAGLGIGGTEACLKNLELARRYGFSAVLASPPAYIKAPQRGLREHYLKLSEGGLPICIYEIPGRASVSLQVETIKELADSNRSTAKNLISVKDATANLQRALDQSRLLGKRFALLSGDDGTLAPFLSTGGVGSISVISHLYPKSMNRIVKFAAEGKFAEATAEQNRIMPVIEAIYWESNPVPIKSILAATGLIREAHFCEPLVPMRKDLLDKAVELHRNIKD